MIYRAVCTSAVRAFFGAMQVSAIVFYDFLGPYGGHRPHAVRSVLRKAQCNQKDCARQPAGRKLPRACASPSGTAALDKHKLFANNRFISLSCTGGVKDETMYGRG